MKGMGIFPIFGREDIASTSDSIEAEAFEYHPQDSKLIVYGEEYRVSSVEVRIEVFDVARSMNANQRRTFMSFNEQVRIDIDEDGLAVVRRIK